MTIKQIPLIGDTVINVEDWAAERKLSDPDHSSAQTQALKFFSEAGELADNLAKGKDIRDDVGDCVVVLIIIARLAGTTLAECLAMAYEDIKDRKGLMYKGVFIKESDPRYAELMEPKLLLEEQVCIPEDAIGMLTNQSFFDSLKDTGLGKL